MGGRLHPGFAHVGIPRVNRRQFIGASGVGLFTAALSGCTGGGRSSEQDGSGTVRWWDQFRPLTSLFEEELFGPYMEENPDITVERRALEAPELGQALQAARRSDQLPEVHSLAGLETSAAALVSEEWFQPLSDFVDVESSPVSDLFIEGFQRFEGDVFSVPLFSGRWHEGSPWLNTALFEEADIDPEDEPQTWDEFREVLRRVSDTTDSHGILLPGQDPGYLNALVTRLAQSAGAAGDIDWHTGEYVYDTQPFLDAMEFLRSLEADGLVHPSSPSMGPQDARARWAGGEAGIYMWGTWFIGGLLVDEADAVERGVGNWSIPRPESERNLLHSQPAGSQFWISVDAREPEVAAELILRMTSREFQVALAGAMDQPPALLEAMDEAEVHPAYAQCVANFEQDVRIAPAPEAGASGVWRALAQMQDVRPHVGDIAQSMLAGEDVDVEAELTHFREEMTAERDRAIEAVQSEGADLDVDSWVFSNWDPENDYEPGDYDGR